MFKNTSPEEASRLIGGNAYEAISRSLADEMLKTRYNRSIYLTDYLEDVESGKIGQGKIATEEFHSDIVRFTGCALITLFQRDGYTPGLNYPIDGRNAHETWLSQAPQFGLPLGSICGLTHQEVRESVGILSGIRIEISEDERARYIEEYEEYKQTYPRNQRNQSLIIQSYLENLSGIPQKDIAKKCKPLALLMGLDVEGNLSIEEWMKCTTKHAEAANNAFGAVGNKWAKNEKGILKKRFNAVDSNIALLTTFPAQMLYLEGHSLDDIVQGLAARIDAFARKLLGEYEEYDAYVEFSIKRPFMSFPDSWIALGITAKDFLGSSIEDQELSDIFRNSVFRNGMYASFDYAALRNIDIGCLRPFQKFKGNVFFEESNFERLGFMAHNRFDRNSIKQEDLVSLLDSSIGTGKGVPIMLTPESINGYASGGVNLIVEFITETVGPDLSSRFLYSLLRGPGLHLFGVDNTYIARKEGFIGSLAEEKPELLHMIFERLLAERNPPKGLTALFLKHIRPTADQMNKIKGSSRDMILSRDLGL